MNYYKIFNGKLASELRKKGFWIVAVEPNLKKPWLNVFCFEDTAEFRQALTEITNK